MAFLSACVRYDPPPDGLLGFADHGVAAYGDFVNPLNPWADEDAAPQMLAPPIRFLYDAEVLLAEQQRRHDRMLGALHRRLAPRGVDLWEMVYDIEFWGPRDDEGDAAGEDGAPEGDAAAHPYIIVEAQTTEDDVRNAFRLMAAALAERPRAVKPRRDPLVCLQCAIWYDACGWSHERIAKHFGWKAQRPAHAKPRSETARQYIAEGRALLVHGKAAA